MPEVISNTSPIQYLFQADLLRLLPALYGSVILPEAVASELAEGRARGVALPIPSSLPWVKVRSVSQPAMLGLITDLGPGEREALALATGTPGALLLLDDSLARRHARLLGLTFTGTLGVLLKAQQVGEVGPIAPILDRLEDLGFRLDTVTRAAVLKLAAQLPG